MTTDIIKNENTAMTKIADMVDFSIPTGYINTFDLESNADKIKVINAVNNSVPLKDYMDKELHICDCITMPGIRKGRNGMPDTNCTNTHLIDVDGVSYFSQSDGVARAIIMFAALWHDFGKSTELGCLRMKCVSQDLPNGNTLKTMVICE